MTLGPVNRQTGILKRQNLTNLASTTFSGTYAYGREGVDSSGHRYAVAGVIASSGAGAITNVTFDFDDNGAVGTLSGGSGSYSLATNAPSGRGTIQTMISTPGGPVTSNYVMYVVSPSDFFALSSDPVDANHPIQGGENLLQTGPFSTAALNSGGFVFYSGGIDPSSGGSDAVIGQAQVTTSGNATVIIDENTNGTSQTEVNGSAVLTVAPSGRVTGTGAILGYSFVIYLVDSTQGFIVGLDPFSSSGYIQKQTLNSFSTSTITGQFFFGGGAPTTGGAYDSGTVTFNPGSGITTGKDDESSPSGLQPNSPTNGPYTFSAATTAPGQGNVGGWLAYIISPSELVFSVGTVANPSPAEIVIVQH
jgi:hypothetical protein